jgi:hypothetical protein
VVEHLRDRPRCQARGERELAGGQLAALVELQQQLELGVAELGGAEVGVAATEPAEGAKDVTEGQSEGGQLVDPPRLPGRRLDLCRVRSGTALMALP